MKGMDEEKKLNGKTVTVAAGAGLGAWVGSSIGIAGFFGAISGALPLAALGAYAAHKVHKAIKDGSAKEFTQDFVEGAKEGWTGGALRGEELKARRAALRAEPLPIKIVRKTKKPPEPE